MCVFVFVYICMHLNVTMYGMYEEFMLYMNIGFAKGHTTTYARGCSSPENVNSVFVSVFLVFHSVRRVLSRDWLKFHFLSMLFSVFFNFTLLAQPSGTLWAAHP